jgi:AraC-like DNA-binding protein
VNHAHRGRTIDNFGHRLYVRAVRELHVPRGTASARILLNLALRHGLSSSGCLRGTNLCQARIEDPVGEITVAQELRLVRNLTAALPDRPALGLEAGSNYHIDQFGILGFACMSAPRLRDIIDISLRYQDLTFTLARAETVREPDRTFVAVDVSHLRVEVRRFVADQALATIWATISDLSAAPPRPRLELAYDSISELDRYQHIFGVRPVLGQPVHRIGFDNQAVEAPRLQADPTALQLCEQGCRELLDRRRRQVGTAGLVRDRLARAQGPVPTMDVIAADLHITARTLRRALRNEGLSFRELDEAVRRERAADLLDTGLPIERIAAQIGYSSSSAFVHAFKRWHGVTPGAFRDTISSGEKGLAWPSESGSSS